MFWSFSISAGKASILLLYVRIFPSVILRRFVVSFLVIVGLNCTATVLFFLLRCHGNPRATWDINLAPLCATGSNAGWLGTGITNILTDLFILCLPLPYMWRLQVPTRRLRIALGCLIGLGALTVLASMLRVIASLGDYTDFSYQTLQPNMYGLLEATTTIFCACAPMLRPLVRHWRQGPLSRRSQMLARTPRETDTLHVSNSNPSSTGGRSPWGSAQVTESALKHSSVATQGFTYLADTDHEVCNVDSRRTTIITATHTQPSHASVGKDLEIEMATASPTSPSGVIISPPRIASPTSRKKATTNTLPRGSHRPDSPLDKGLPPIPPAPAQALPPRVSSQGSVHVPQEWRHDRSRRSPRTVQFQRTKPPVGIIETRKVRSPGTPAGSRSSKAPADFRTSRPPS